MSLLKARRATLTILLFGIALLLVEQQQHAENNSTLIWEGKATAIQEIFVDLRAGEIVQFETRNLSPKSDPVLNLLSPDGKEVAADDNGAMGFAAKLTHQAESSGKYSLIVRAKTTHSKGTADIYKGNSLLRSNTAFGGMVVSVDAPLRAKEELEVIVPPNGVHWHRFYILASDNVHIIVKRGGSQSGASFTANSDMALGSVVIGATTERDEGPVRLLRNDAALPGHDPDSDGLGSELERALGTCSSLNGFVKNFNCNQAVDARDTDGDGISDGWEVLGRRFTEHPAPNLTKHTYLPLAKWGADPRHKDLFVEVDFMLRSPTEMARKMTPIVARDFARYYQDEIGSFSESEKAAHAATLKNPDGLPGIRVHLDTGVPPENAADATIFGDWGGYTAVQPIRNSEGNWEGAKYSTAWMTNMHPSRLGIFRYALPYFGGGGQTTEEQFAFTFSIDSASGLVHESGHAMGIGHSGPKRITGDVDVNCKPNYHSLMNYAFTHRGYGFSDGREFPSWNNQALKEWEAVPPSNTVLLDVLENEFKYYVDRGQGHVDWNRDGTFAGKGKLVRAYANFRPGGSCEYTRYNKGLVHEEARSDRAPALARLGNRLYAFFVKDGVLSYTYSTSPWDCPTPGKESCGTWQTPKNLQMDAGRGVDVVKFGVGENAKLLIVMSTRKGRLWEMRLSLNAQGREVRTEPRLISHASGMGEPSLARVDTCAVDLAYKDRDGKLRQNQITCASNWEWEGEKLAQAASGETISIGSAASPAIARAYLPWRPGLPSLYGAFADANGRLDIWWFNGETERWEKTDVLETRPGFKGRPAMAWVPDQNTSETPGRFYLIFVRHNPANPPDNKARLVQMMMSYVNVTKRDDGGIEKSEKVGLLSNFDNDWHSALGIDLLYEPGTDTNLRIIETLKTGELLFKPKADGINDFTYQNYNDWEVLRVGVCKYMVNPQGLVQNPIKCPEKTWFD